VSKPSILALTGETDRQADATSFASGPTPSAPRVTRM
jgi:hypothetical protein